MKEQVKPNFLIVGAAKSGTSSLADYLGQHPEVYMSPVKEPYFFVPGFAMDSWEEYLGLFKGVKGVKGEKAIGEASTGYLYSEPAPRAIKEALGDVRIVIILRHPLEMAFSLWSYMRRVGNEDASWEEAVGQRKQRASSEQFLSTRVAWPYNYLYIERAMYFEQVKRYIDCFGRGNVKVLVFEEFVKEPVAACRELFGFLGVDTGFEPAIRVVNPGGQPRLRLIRGLQQRRYRVLRALLPATVRSGVRAFVRDLNVKKGGKTEMSDKERRRMLPLFAEDIKRLEALLGRELWR